MWCGTMGNRSGCFDRNDVNSAVALSFSRFILQHLVDVADEGLVHPPPSELAGWKDILEHLAPLPRGWVHCHDNGGAYHAAGHAPFSRNFTRPCQQVTQAPDPANKSVVEVFLPQESPWFFTTRYNPLEFYRCAFASPCWPLRVSSHLAGLSTASGLGRVSGSDRIRRR